MKKRYLLFFSYFLFALHFNAQNAKTNDPLEKLSVASDNATSGIKSYNIEDLQYHVKHSKAAIIIVIKELQSINCTIGLEKANEISDLLDTVSRFDELVTARHHLSLTEPLFHKAFYEYEVCTLKENTNDALASLEEQQSNLRKQQLALEQRAKDLKRELEEQKEKELALKKEELINLNQNRIKQNIIAFDEVLKVCSCQATLVNSKDNIVELKTKDVEQIKVYYLDKTIELTESYLTKLKACKNKKPQI